MRTKFVALFSGCVVLAAGLSSCADGPSCGEGAESAVRAVELLVEAVQNDDVNAACVLFPEGATEQQLATELAAYTEFKDAPLEMISEQMGSAYFVQVYSTEIVGVPKISAEPDVTERKVNRHIQVDSERRGRWIFGKDTYLVTPTTFSNLPHESTPTPSSATARVTDDE